MATSVSADVFMRYEHVLLPVPPRPPIKELDHFESVAPSFHIHFHEQEATLWNRTFVSVAHRAPPPLNRKDWCLRLNRCYFLQVASFPRPDSFHLPLQSQSDPSTKWTKWFEHQRGFKQFFLPFIMTVSVNGVLRFYHRETPITSFSGSATRKTLYVFTSQAGNWMRSSGLCWSSGTDVTLEIRQRKNQLQWKIRLHQWKNYLKYIWKYTLKNNWKARNCT